MHYNEIKADIWFSKAYAKPYINFITQIKVDSDCVETTEATISFPYNLIISISHPDDGNFP
jgi:hypothetical protein